MLYYARKKSNPEYKRCVKLFHFLTKVLFQPKNLYSVFVFPHIVPSATSNNLQMQNIRKKRKIPPSLLYTMSTFC